MNTRDESLTTIIIKRRFLGMSKDLSVFKKVKFLSLNYIKLIKVEKKPKTFALMEQKRMKNGTNKTEDNFHHFSFETIAKHNPKSLYYILLRALCPDFYADLCLLYLCSIWETGVKVFAMFSKKLQLFDRN